MHKFEILPHTADIRVRIMSSTRAGMLIAALNGMFYAAKPRLIEEAEETRRPFALKADDFATLLIDFLNEAVALSDANHEVYQEVSFDLITDKEARGAFVGRPVTGFETQIKGATFHDLKVEKNVLGDWETIVTFDA